VSGETWRDLARLTERMTPGRWEIEREELDARYFDDEEQETAFPERVGPLAGFDHDSDDSDRVEADVLAVALVPELLAVARAADAGARSGFYAGDEYDALVEALDALRARMCEESGK
jgi:hypothetical protein